MFSARPSVMVQKKRQRKWGQRHHPEADRVAIRSYLAPKSCKDVTLTPLCAPNWTQSSQSWRQGTPFEPPEKHLLRGAKEKRRCKQASRHRKQIAFPFLRKEKNVGHRSPPVSVREEEKVRLLIIRPTRQASRLRTLLIVNLACSEREGRHLQITLYPACTIVYLILRQGNIFSLILRLYTILPSRGTKPSRSILSEETELHNEQALLPRAVHVAGGTWGGLRAPLLCPARFGP